MKFGIYPDSDSPDEPGVQIKSIVWLDHTNTLGKDTITNYIF